MNRFTFFLFLFPFSLCAQSLDITMKGGILTGWANITGAATFISEDNGAPKGTYAGIQASTPLFKGFHLGTEIGVNSAESYISETLEMNGLVHNYSGRNKINTFHFALIPEYRFLKNQLFFINAGFGIYKDMTNHFNGNAHGRTGASSIEIIDTQWFARDSDIGAFAGLGLRPHINKRVSLLLEARYTNLFVDKTVRQFVNVQYKLINLNFGLSYNLAD